MALIGRQLGSLSDRVVLDNIAVTTTDTFNLLLNGVAFVPNSAEALTVSLNGIIQKPQGSYTVSGSQIIFSSSLTSGTDVIDFIIAERAITLQTPSAGSVGTSQLANGAVTTAKLADSSVSLAKLTATGTQDSTTFLRGDNTFAVPPLGGITEADQWRLSTTLLGDAHPISSNWERVDTDGLGYFGTGMTQSSGVFTFPSTGYWLISGYGNFQTESGYNSLYHIFGLRTTTDGTNYDEAASGWDGGTATYYGSGSVQILFDVTNTSTHKVRFDIDHHSPGYLLGNTSTNYTAVSFVRLGDT